MEIITPRRIPEPNMYDYSQKREIIFKEFTKYLKGKDLLKKFQRAEISIDFEVDTVNRSVSINPKHFAIYRVSTELKESVNKDLISILKVIKQRIDQ